MGNELILDEAAEALFRELGGTDAARSSCDYDMTGMTDTLHDQDRRLDPWRGLLIAFTRDIAAYFEAWKHADMREAERVLKEMGTTLVKLNKMPDHDGRILIRHQGRGIPGEGRASVTYDYSVLFGGVRMDIPQVREASRRMGSTASEFPAEFSAALDTLSNLSVNTLLFRLPSTTDPAARKTLKACLTALGVYFKTLAMEEARSRTGAPRTKAPPYIVDEHGKPDPNLTTLAVINKQKRETVAQVVGKIAQVFAAPGSAQGLDECTDAFEAFFAIPKIKGQLARPPVEVNNLKWLLSTCEADYVMADEVDVARHAAQLFGKTSKETARLLDGLYAPDFRFVNAYQIADRMGLATRLIGHLEETVADPARMEQLVEHVLEMMEIRLDVVREEDLDAITMEGDQLSARIGEGDVIKVRADSRLMESLTFFRARAVTKSKVKSMLQNAVSLTPSDYAIIARDFGIPALAAEELISLIKGCFDNQGHFLRGAFEKRIPAFFDHKDKIFEFLWHFLKEHMHKNERIGFLNSLKVLIDRMEGPSLALYTLLTDFARDPETVTFSDRNALMLCNVLLRDYNKELHQDIEMTPEEVLRVVDGLNRDAVDYAREIIDGEKDKFFLKFRHIHRKVRESLGDSPRGASLPFRYLLTLEREVYMLFALVGGVTGQAILRSALSEYADPESGIYELPESGKNLAWLLQILQVLIRAVGREGDRNDLVSLNEIRPRKSYFMNLSQDSRHIDQVNRLLKWTDKSAEKLRSRLDA